MEFRGLTRRFLLIVLGLFVAVAAVSSILLSIEVQSIVRKLGRSYVTERAMRERARVGDLLEHEGAVALRLASAPQVVSWMEMPADGGRRVDAFRVFDSFRRAFRDRNWFAVSGESRTYYNQPATGDLAETTLSPDVPADIWYFNTVKADRDISFNLDFNPLIGATKVWINCVVHDAAGRVIGLAGTGLDITEVVRSLVGADDDGTVSMLIDSDGAITAHPDAAYMEHNAKIWTSGRKITVFDLAESSADRSRLHAMVARASAGEIAVDEIAIQGHSALTAVAPIPQLNWMTVVSVNTAAVISAADFIPLFVLLVVSLLLVLLVLALLMDRLVLRPLSAMTESARQVAAGGYDIVLPFDRRDEIGRLAGAFNRMTVQVKKHTGNLEQMVRTRTAELREANEQMMESIRYAQLIQSGLMPSKQLLDERIYDYSLFHRQRDVVGGDLLYFREMDDGFLLGVIDCEGHGVPGALMTMMADSYLQLIASRGAADDPAGLIEELDNLVRTTTSLGGLAIGLCACRPARNEVVFAGAAMPLYVLDADGLTAIKGRPKSVGYRHGETPGRGDNHRISSIGRTFFLLTDGFVDQIGGDERAGRSYGTTRLFDFLTISAAEARDGSLPDWELEFDRYRGEQTQRDDVLALAFRLPVNR